MVVIYSLIYLATLVHVFRESKRMNDAPIRNALLVALCIWPLPYLFWDILLAGNILAKN